MNGFHQMNGINGHHKHHLNGAIKEEESDFDITNGINNGGVDTNGATPEEEEEEEEEEDEGVDIEEILRAFERNGNGETDNESNGSHSPKSGSQTPKIKYPEIPPMPDKKTAATKSVGSQESRFAIVINFGIKSQFADFSVQTKTYMG
jgi:hypothetical protein